MAAVCGFLVFRRVPHVLSGEVLRSATRLAWRELVVGGRTNTDLSCVALEVYFFCAVAFFQEQVVAHCQTVVCIFLRAEMRISWFLLSSSFCVRLEFVWCVLPLFVFVVLLL